MGFSPDGHRQRFETLIRQHLPRLRGFARRLRRHGGIDSDDLLQDTMERALCERDWLAAQDERTFRAWLCTTLRRRFIDLHRRRHIEERVCSGLELIEAPVRDASQRPSGRLQAGCGATATASNCGGFASCGFGTSHAWGQEKELRYSWIFQMSQDK